MDLNELKTKVLSTIGQAGDAAKEFGGKAADVTRDLAGKAADKAKSGGRIAKLSVAIATEKENMKKTYLELGKLYYEAHKDDADGFFAQLCGEIAQMESAIAEKEAEIAALKASFGKNGEADIDVEFEEVVAEAEAEVEVETEAEADAPTEEQTEEEE